MLFLIQNHERLFVMWQAMCMMRIMQQVYYIKHILKTYIILFIFFIAHEYNILCRVFHSFCDANFISLPVDKSRARPCLAFKSDGRCLRLSRVSHIYVQINRFIRYTFHSLNLMCTSTVYLHTHM